MTKDGDRPRSLRGLWFSFVLSLVGAGLIVYDLLGPHKGWTILGMVLLMVGTLLLRKF